MGCNPSLRKFDGMPMIYNNTSIFSAYKKITHETWRGMFTFSNRPKLSVGLHSVRYRPM